MMYAVVYKMTSPHVKSYIGAHNTPDAYVWPGRGEGKLPDGYPGSGTTHWRNAKKFHGIESMTWEILSRHPSEEEARLAETQAIIEAKARGEVLYNAKEGGYGCTSADAIRFNACPKNKAKQSASLKISLARPESKERQRAASKALNARPEVKAKHSASSKASNARPEVKAKIIAGLLAANARPGVKERRIAAQKIVFARPEQRALRSEISKARMNTPEAKARQSAAAKAMYADPIRKAEILAKQAATKAKNVGPSSYSTERRSSIMKAKYEDPVRKAEILAKCAATRERKRNARST